MNGLLGKATGPQTALLRGCRGRRSRAWSWTGAAAPGNGRSSAATRRPTSACSRMWTRRSGRWSGRPRHLYNLRESTTYRRRRGVLDRTRPTRTAIGERRPRELHFDLLRLLDGDRRGSLRHAARPASRHWCATGRPNSWSSV